MKDTFKNCAIYILLAAVLYMALQLYFIRLQPPASADVLPENIKHETVVKKNEVFIKSRVSDKITGKDTVIKEVKYLPTEGNVKVQVSSEGVADVRVVNKGFTFTPGLYFMVSDSFNIGLGARLVYWNRFGAGAGLSMAVSDKYIEPFAFADMRLTDLGIGSVAVGVYIKPKAVGISAALYFN